MRCMIIEDEQPAVELLSSYIAQLPDWQLVKVSKNALDAMEYLKSHKVDILFVDIQMPQINGIVLLQSLTDPPLSIITSAYSEYAVNAYDLNVFDYLLKPYSFSRFLKTYNRVTKQIPTVPEPSPQSERFIVLKEKGHNRRVALQEIIYAESQRSYLQVITHSGVLRTKLSITAFEELLPSDAFVRVHRSFLVALDKVSSYTGKELLLGEWTVPIGRHFKKALEDRMNKGI